jgi:hypothetical protein
MAKAPTPSKILCLRETEEHFFLAANKPFSPMSRAYRRLSKLAIADPEVRHLEGGSQVFVYHRTEFDADSVFPGSERRIKDSDLFLERIILEGQNLGEHIALDPVMQSVAAKMPPAEDPEKLIPLTPA